MVSWCGRAGGALGGGLCCSHVSGRWTLLLTRFLVLWEPLSGVSTAAGTSWDMAAGAIDAKELHVGLLLVYDKLNKASGHC